MPDGNDGVGRHGGRFLGCGGAPQNSALLLKVIVMKEEQIFRILEKKELKINRKLVEEFGIDIPKNLKVRININDDIVNYSSESYWEVNQ